MVVVGQSTSSQQWLAWLGQCFFLLRHSLRVSRKGLTLIWYTTVRFCDLLRIIAFIGMKPSWETFRLLGLSMAHGKTFS